jgi:hypothetical protein
MTPRYEIGDEWYCVLTQRGLHPKKIHMTDENGITWYRHHTPPISHVIDHYVIVGRSWRVFEGQNENVECHVDYTLHHQRSSELVSVFEDEFEDTLYRKYFRSIQEAEDYVRERFNETNE